MRNILLLLSACLIFSGCDKGIEDRSKRNQDWIWWVDDATGKGEWIKLGNRTTVRDGTYTSFYHNSNICEIGQLKNGRAYDTTFRYDINGKLDCYLIEYEDSTDYHFIKNGPYRRYHNDGTLFIEGIVQEHLDGDVWLIKYPNGHTKLDRDVRGDNGYYVEYFENGNMKAKAVGKFLPRNYLDRESTPDASRYKLENGCGMTFFESGQKKDSINYLKGYPEGRALYWYANGNIKTSTNFIQGLSNGQAIAYHENGKIKAMATCKNDAIVGRYIGYDPTGKKVIDTFFSTPFTR